MGNQLSAVGFEPRGSRLESWEAGRLEGASSCKLPGFLASQLPGRLTIFDLDLLIFELVMVASNQINKL